MGKREEYRGVVMYICRWCLSHQKEPLAKSHIIPKAFFNYDGKTDRVLIAQNQRGVRRPIGSYDPNILCQKCEKDFSIIDSQAARILLQDFQKELIPFNDRRDNIAFQISGDFFQPIKRFLIYVLWRASVSELEEFKRVQLGPYEKRIKQSLINNEVFETDEYSFYSCKIKNPSGHLLPYRDRQQGRTYYMLYLADYVFSIKIDSQKSVSPFEAFATHHNVAFIKFDKTPSGARNAMVEVAKTHEKNFGMLKSFKTI